MRYRPLLIAVLVVGFAGVTVSCREPDEKTAKELKALEGVWAEDPPKGNGRRNAVRFQDGKMGWQSTRYMDGEPLIGHSKGYVVALDPAAKPKRITLTRGEGEDKETRLGIYEVDGDTLKIALGRGKDHPAKFDDKDAQVMTLMKVRPTPAGKEGKPSGPGPKPEVPNPGEKGDAGKPRLSTPFEKELACSIVTINTLKSGGNKVLYCWTDGVSSSRVNYPIDLYIDTNDVIDWAQPEARCTVSLEAKSSTKTIKSDHVVTPKALHSRIAGRGLIACKNVFRIDPEAGVVHHAGAHRIAIRVVVGADEYRGSCTFTIR